MTHRPLPAPAVVVDSITPQAARTLLPEHTPVPGPLPHEPYGLWDRRWVWAVPVDGPATAVAALDAAGRGVALVVALDLSPEERGRFLDDLGRVAVVRAGASTEGDRVRLLSEVHRQLLVGLGTGGTLSTVARALGLSRRSASRRLAEARSLLGVATTTEAVLAVQRS